MIFGHVPTDQAEGTVLAHTLRLGAGGILKKGRLLTAEDVTALLKAGHREVVAARLEAGDVAEDEAAARVGRPLGNDHLEPAEAHTGRCNLIARDRGVLVVDRSRVDRLNRVSETITVATLAPFAVVERGDIAATVKVIPFAVAEREVAACEAITREGAPVLSLRPLRRRAVGLVLTRLTGTREELLDRAEETTRRRLAQLGSELVLVERCQHREEAVAFALDAMMAADCELILLLGASAIVDRGDVIPAAVVRRGGRIEHFGMPVDPGNLLLLASLGEAQVVGVPGCARSLRPSGFDWVVERLLVGLPVGAVDLQGMGVGGLLKDIGSRPAPRAPHEVGARGPRVAAIVLAAGRSQRMGGANKLLSDVGGQAMVARAVDAVLASRAEPVVVVTGHDAERVRAALSGRALRFVHNPDYAAGMSTSLRAGVEALADEGDLGGALVCLGDMPWVQASHLDALIEAFGPGGHRIVVPFVERKRGNPILWSAHFFGAMARLSGDVGARELLEQHPELVLPVAFDDDGVLIDIDTPDALAALDS